MKKAFAASLAIAAAAAALTAFMIIANIATTESIPYKVAEVPLEAAESTVLQQAISPGGESRIPDPAAAWITIPGTTVDYPVVQASGDSPDFYLTHDASGERSAWGAPYIHSGCEQGADSPLVIVLGHNMSDGTMFAPIANYSRRPFAQEHKTILVRTEEKARRLEVFARKDVEQLCQLIDRVATDERADAGDDAGVVLDLEQRSVSLIPVAQVGEHLVCIGHHRAELPHAEKLVGAVLAQPAHAQLGIERARPGRPNVYDNGENHPGNQQHGNRRTRGDDVKDALHKTVAAPREIGFKPGVGTTEYLGGLPIR